LERLKKNFTDWTPGLNIVGSHHGYFSSGEEPAILDDINRANPDFIWVGLGTPRQQAWIHRHKAGVKRGLLLAVGFAFDVNAGMKPDPPRWMQQSGLGWLFRLMSEPRRLAGRYFIYNSRFLAMLAAGLMSGTAWKPSETPQE